MSDAVRFKHHHKSVEDSSQVGSKLYTSRKNSQRETPIYTSKQTQISLNFAFWFQIIHMSVQNYTQVAAYISFW